MYFNSFPSSWQSILSSELESLYFQNLQLFINSEYLQYNCFPEEKNIFRALAVTPFEDVKVVILGQDPYHTPGAAMWLSFSIPNGVKIQPSLRNIFKELESDLGIIRTNSDLTDLAEQGILLLNSVLTVRSGDPGSHANHGWERFTDSIISLLSEKGEGIVFVLWGNHALSKNSLIDSTRHCIIESSHPSPFSSYRWFFGSRPFSRINQYLTNHWKSEIKWN